MEDEETGSFVGSMPDKAKFSNRTDPISNYSIDTVMRNQPNRKGVRGFRDRAFIKIRGFAEKK
jgi:hypothetical protein